ncbi:hypothetical protein ACFQU7_35250 [Pseudoroseomonas wenyumeiae]
MIYAAPGQGRPVLIEAQGIGQCLHHVDRYRWADRQQAGLPAWHASSSFHPCYSFVLGQSSSGGVLRSQVA